MAGYLNDNFGARAAFDTLTVAALVGVAVVAMAMTETEPEEQKPHH